MAQTIGTVLINVESNTAKLVDGMNKAEAYMKKQVDSMKSTLGILGKAFVVVGGAGGIGVMVKSSITAADQLGVLSEKLSTTVTGLSELQYVAKFSGVEMKTLESALSAMIRRTNNFTRSGGGAASTALKELGISAEYAKENFTDTETTFKLIIDRLRDMPDSYHRTAIAQDIFSKSAAGVVSMANLSTKEMQNLILEGEKFGAIISDDMAKSAGELNDNLDRLTENMNGMFTSLANNALPAMVEISDSISSIDTDDISIAINRLETLAITVTGTALSFKALSTGIRISNKYAGAFNLVNLRLVGSITAHRIATVGLSTAMRAIPIVAVGSAIAIIADHFITASSNAKTLEMTLKTTGEELKKLTNNQLAYKQSILEIELIDQRLTMQNAKADATHQGFFESDSHHAKDLAYKDEQIKLFEKMTKKLRDIKRLRKEISIPIPAVNSKVIKTPKSTKPFEIKDADLKTYYIKLGQYEKAWQIESAALSKRFGKDKYADLAKMYKTEFFDKFKEKVELEPIEIQNADLKTYYIKLGQYEKAWQIESAALSKRFGKDKYADLAKMYKTEFFDKFKEKVESEPIEIEATIKTSFVSQDQQMDDLSVDWNNAYELFPNKMEEINEHFLAKQESILGKNNDDTQKQSKTASVNYGSAIASAIVMGIDGSSLEEIVSSVASSTGSSMVSSGVGALAMSGAINPYAAIGGGVALSLLGGSYETEIVSQTNYLEELVKLTKEQNLSVDKGQGIYTALSIDIYKDMQRGMHQVETQRQEAYMGETINADGEREIAQLSRTITDTHYEANDITSKTKDSLNKYFMGFTDNFNDVKEKLLAETIHKSKKRRFRSTKRWTEYIYEYKSDQDKYFEAFAELYTGFDEAGLLKMSEQTNNLAAFQRELGLVTLEDDIEAQKAYINALDGLNFDIDELTLDNFKDFMSADNLSNIAVDSTMELDGVTTAFQNFYDMLQSNDSVLLEATNAIRDFAQSLGSLASSGQNTINSLVHQAYTPQQSLEYFLGSSQEVGGSGGELNSLIDTFESYFTNGMLNSDVSYDVMSKTYDELNSMVGSTSSAITNNYKSSSDGMGLQGDLLNNLEDYQDWLIRSEDIMSVKIVDSGDIGTSLADLGVDLTTQYKEILVSLLGESSNISDDDIKSFVENEVSILFTTNIEVIQTSIKNLNAEDLTKLEFDSNLDLIDMALSNLGEHHQGHLKYTTNLEEVQTLVDGINYEEVKDISFDTNLNDIQKELNDLEVPSLSLSAIMGVKIEMPKLPKLPTSSSLKSYWSGYAPDTSNIENAFKSAWGFSMGGFTPNIGKDEVAGVVHGGEYVAPMYQVKKYPELFNGLDNERTGYKAGGFVGTSGAFKTNNNDLVSEIIKLRVKLETRLEAIENHTAINKEIVKNTKQQLSVTKQMGRRGV